MPIFSTQNHRDSNFAPNHIQEEQQTNKMGPKRRQPQDPKKPGRKPRARKKEPVRSPVQLASQLELIEAAHAVLDHNQSSQLRSQMSLILHKPNRLTEMIRNNSSQDSSRRRLSFEKDDGFKYKRGLQFRTISHRTNMWSRYPTSGSSLLDLPSDRSRAIVDDRLIIIEVNDYRRLAMDLKDYHTTM